MHKNASFSKIRGQEIAVEKTFFLKKLICIAGGYFRSDLFFQKKNCMANFVLAQLGTAALNEY